MPGEVWRLLDLNAHHGGQKAHQEQKDGARGGPEAADGLGGHGVEAAVVAPDIVAVDDEDRNACQEQDHK